MKNLLPLLFLIIVSCKSTKNMTADFVVNEAILINTLNCPENGDCTIELLPNSSLEFKNDEFGNLYPVISEGNKTIFKYIYTRNPIPNTQDSNYSEIVFAELEATISEKTLTDEALQDVKLHFGRLCFCKGETGYYPIKNGEFKISKSTKNTFKIDFNFKISEVPQIISTINETVGVKSNETK
ncbi:MAG: hypothetical protein PHW92_02500 [Lutibacter sp.]|nr:hypothetical protein [Lutibacter sp.]